MDEIEVKAQEIRAEIETAKTGATEAKAKAESVEVKMTEIETGFKGIDLESKKMREDFEKLNEGLNDLNKKMAETKMEKQETFVDALKAVYEGAEFKTQLQEVMDGKRAKSQTFLIEVKDDPTSVITSGATNPVSRTYGGGISGALYEPNKFITNMQVVTVPADKNRAMWFDGVYFDNADYVEELTAVTTGDGATIEEKYRELAKIGSMLKFSSETTTEMSYFVNWARGKGIEAILSKVNSLIYSGVGADGGAYTKKIYGLKTQGSTAFNATTAGMALSVQDANITDLILAARTQVMIQGKGNYIPDAVYLYPSEVSKIRLLKDKGSNYINVLTDGSLLVHGVTILEDATIGATEMLMVTRKVLQLHQKAALETELERNAGTDGYTLHMRWKGQVVVPTTDKISDIDILTDSVNIERLSNNPVILSKEALHQIYSEILTEK